MENPPVPRQTRQTRPTRCDAKIADDLFRAYGGRLYAYFQLMLADETASKRALERTLMAADDDEGWPDDPGQDVPWLFALAHAECHKHQFADAVGAGRHWATTGGNGDRRPGLPEIARRAVARLPPDLREAFILSAPHNELSLPQLTEVLGVRLVVAADLRAEAGLEFVRAVQSCAWEADFTELSGSNLRIRAEESLARDAAEPAPPLLGPPAGPRAGTPTWTVPPPATPTVTDLPAFAGEPETTVDAPILAGEPETTVDPPFLGALQPPTSADLLGQPSFHRRRNRLDTDFGLDDDTGFGADPLPRLTRERSGHRGRVVLAWVSGVIVVGAGVAIAANALMSGPDNSITLSPSGSSPSSAVLPSAGFLPSTPPQTQHSGPRHQATATPKRTTPTAAPPSASAVVPQPAPTQAAPRSQAPAPKPKPPVTTSAPRPKPSTTSGSPTQSPPAPPASQPQSPPSP